MSNLLAMPLVSVMVLTGTNEDWIDAIKFVVEQEGVAIEDLPQLDISGIIFEMEVRRLPPDNEVVLRGSTVDGTLFIGAAPDYGFLLIKILHQDMKIQRPGNYVGDIIGRDEVAIRRCVTMDLEIVLGVTRP